jgi:hypothetical protein
MGALLSVEGLEWQLLTIEDAQFSEDTHLVSRG